MKKHKLIHINYYYYTNWPFKDKEKIYESQKFIISIIFEYPSTG